MSERPCAGPRAGLCTEEVGVAVTYGEVTGTNGPAALGALDRRTVEANQSLGNHPLTSTIRCAPAKEKMHTLPPTPTLDTTAFGIV